MAYDELSTDSMFTKVLARLDEQDRAATRRETEQNAKLDRIEAQAIKTNGRVNALETWRKILTAKVALIATGVSMACGFLGWALNLYLSHK